LCAISSYDSQIGQVGEWVVAEMRKLGFDEVTAPTAIDQVDLNDGANAPPFCARLPAALKE
jgi:hypothetical protein